MWFILDCGCDSAIYRCRNIYFDISNRAKSHQNYISKLCFWRRQCNFVSNAIDGKIGAFLYNCIKYWRYVRREMNLIQISPNIKLGRQNSSICYRFSFQFKMFGTRQKIKTWWYLNWHSFSLYATLTSLY